MLYDRGSNVSEKLFDRWNLRRSLSALTADEVADSGEVDVRQAAINKVVRFAESGPAGFGKLSAVVFVVLYHRVITSKRPT